MKMTIDALRIEYTTNLDDDMKFLDIDIFINDEKILDRMAFSKLNFNIIGLDSALDKTQKFPLFVCGCGDEGCAGIMTTPIIRIDGDVIEWEIYSPQECVFRFYKSNILDEIARLKQDMLNELSIDEWRDYVLFGNTMADEIFR